MIIPVFPHLPEKSALRLEGKELGHSDAQCQGDGANVLQGGIAHTPLNAGEIGHMDAGAMGNLFLTDCESQSDLAYVLAESGLVIVHLDRGHYRYIDYESIDYKSTIPLRRLRRKEWRQGGSRWPTEEGDCTPT